jgi:ABC-type polysaccharide/polyol phosphate export permease
VVYFRDLQHITGVILSAWFFVSPVMYDLKFVQHFMENHPSLSSLFMLNPMAVIVTAYRAASISGVSMPMGWPTWTAVAMIAGVYFAGFALFQRLQKNFADLL